MTRRLVALVLIIGAALIWYALRDDLSLAHIVDNERRLRELIRARPWSTFVLGFWLYAIVSVLPGTTGKAVVAGWLFGFWPGMLMVVGALTVAGVFGFLVARGFLRDALRRWFGLRLTRFDRALEHDGAFYLLSLRLLHVPFTLLNYLSGVSRVRLGVFIWTTVVGLVPGTLILVGLGAGLPSLNELFERGVVGLVNPALVVAVLAMALLPWGVRTVLRARDRRRRAGAGPDPLSAGGKAP